MVTILTQKQLDKRLKYWQKKLRLQDWNIKATIVKGQFIKEGCAGHVGWEINSKSANISILHPNDYPEGAMIEQDMENTLVHELLHLHFVAINDYCAGGKVYDLFEEQAIVSIADALIAVEREK